MQFTVKTVDFEFGIGVHFLHETNSLHCLMTSSYIMMSCFHIFSGHLSPWDVRPGSTNFFLQRVLISFPRQYSIFFQPGHLRTLRRATQLQMISLTTSVYDTRIALERRLGLYYFFWNFKQLVVPPNVLSTSFDLQGMCQCFLYLHVTKIFVSNAIDGIIKFFLIIFISHYIITSFIVNHIFSCYFPVRLHKNLSALICNKYMNHNSH